MISFSLNTGDCTIRVYFTGSLKFMYHPLENFGGIKHWWMGWSFPIGWYSIGEWTACIAKPDFKEEGKKLLNGLQY